MASNAQSSHAPNLMLDASSWSFSSSDEQAVAPFFSFTTEEIQDIIARVQLPDIDPSVPVPYCADDSSVFPAVLGLEPPEIDVEQFCGSVTADHQQPMSLAFRLGRSEHVYLAPSQTPHAGPPNPQTTPPAQPNFLPDTNWPASVHSIDSLPRLPGVELHTFTTFNNEYGHNVDVAAYVPAPSAGFAFPESSFSYADSDNTLYSAQLIDDPPVLATGMYPNPYGNYNSPSFTAAPRISGTGSIALHSSSSFLSPTTFNHPPVVPTPHEVTGLGLDFYPTPVSSPQQPEPPLALYSEVSPLHSARDIGSPVDDDARDPTWLPSVAPESGPTRHTRRKRAAAPHLKQHRHKRTDATTLVAEYLPREELEALYAQGADGRLYCTLCPSSFARPGDARRHLQCSHAKYDIAKDDIEQRRCPLCRKVFPRKDACLRHHVDGWCAGDPEKLDKVVERKNRKSSGVGTSKSRKGKGK